MIVSPSNVLLQPLVGRFHASVKEKSRFFANFQAMFCHQVAPQRCRLAEIALVYQVVTLPAISRAVSYFATQKGMDTNICTNTTMLSSSYEYNICGVVL